MRKQIIKAKITKTHTLEVELIEILDDNTERTATMKCDQLVHEDMNKAFAKLKLHLVKICDLYEDSGITPDKFNPEEQLTKFKITSFAIGGEGEHEGVSISGQKELDGGKILNLNSPFTKYSNDDYGYGRELASEIQACVFEVEEYLFNGKYAIKQLDIPFDEVQESNDEIPDENEVTSEVETKKVRGRRKKKVDMKIEASTDGDPFVDVTEKFAQVH